MRRSRKHGIFGKDYSRMSLTTLSLAVAKIEGYLRYRWGGGDHAGTHGFPCRRTKPFPFYTRSSTTQTQPHSDLLGNLRRRELAASRQTHRQPPPMRRDVFNLSQYSRHSDRQVRSLQRKSPEHDFFAMLPE
jgi:hypothetical protein